MKPLIAAILLAVALPAGDFRIVPGMNAFTLATYQQLAGSDSNLILSPFNIATALSMVLGGARGATATEIATVLHQKYDHSYDASLASLLADLTQAGNSAGNELLAANAAWVQKGFPIQPAFEETLAKDYHSPIKPLDFVANPAGARNEINAWTQEHTKDRIKNLFSANSFDEQTRLILTSAIYFYGKWQIPFLTSRTEPGPFLLASGATLQTKFMHQTARFGYTDSPSAQVLEMPYAGTGIAFDVVLPKTPQGLAALEKSLTAETLTGWLGHLTNREVELTLPKFRAESAFSLRQALSAMGMPAAFTKNADFSGIDGRGRLAISEVVHKAFVDVSEQGTEAAAATGIGIHMAAARAPEQTVVFRADHPFVFMIRDTRTGVILFIGRLKSPQSE